MRRWFRENMHVLVVSKYKNEIHYRLGLNCILLAECDAPDESADAIGEDLLEYNGRTISRNYAKKLSDFVGSVA